MHIRALTIRTLDAEVKHWSGLKVEGSQRAAIFGFVVKRRHLAPPA